MNTITNTGLYIDPNCFGKDMLLVETAPYYEYIDKVRSNNILGYKYTVVLPQRGFEKLDVKISGNKLLDVKPGDNISVSFKDLQVKPYLMFRGDRPALMFTAQASDIVSNVGGKN